MVGACCPYPNLAAAEQERLLAYKASLVPHWPLAAGVEIFEGMAPVTGGEAVRSLVAQLVGSALHTVHATQAEAAAEALAAEFGVKV